MFEASLQIIVSGFFPKPWFEEKPQALTAPFVRISERPAANRNQLQTYFEAPAASSQSQTDFELLAAGSSKSETELELLAASSQSETDFELLARSSLEVIVPGLFLKPWFEEKPQALTAPFVSIPGPSFPKT